ncbi:MAG TPA: hypothetical protein VGI46_06865 [Candidatus Acidoferrum sp.]|jgi:hypothetical protein
MEETNLSASYGKGRTTIAVHVEIGLLGLDSKRSGVVLMRLCEKCVVNGAFRLTRFVKLLGLLVVEEGLGEAFGCVEMMVCYFD